MKLSKILSFSLAICLSAQAISAQSSHVQTVMNNYAAFGKGDIPGIAATLAPNCTWFHSGNPAIVPFAGTFAGPDEIAAKFFAVIPTSIEITSFEPSLVGEEGATVITSVKIQGKAVNTGKLYENTVEMRWTFDDSDKVVDYKNIFNPSALEAALMK